MRYMCDIKEDATLIEIHSCFVHILFNEIYKKLSILITYHSHISWMHSLKRLTAINYYRYLNANAKTRHKAQTVDISMSNTYTRGGANSALKNYLAL